ncbi:MAG: DUF465 domain-containing protein [Proteobacteria bacterium]|nr:DUF465 domain-containing protein [Pseudomonadota bacterium]
MGEEEAILLEIEKLKEEHRSIDAIILGLLDAQGGFDQVKLQRMKKRKLWIKDRVSQLESLLHPDDVA